MKSLPVEPAEIVFGPETSAEPGSQDSAAPPRSSRYDDLYHPRIGALAQARHVFLGGNELPARWAGRPRFVVLETGFGLGNNFLATWAAWRADPQRCERLFYVAIERHPPQPADLQRAHAAADEPPLADLAAQLLHAWPPLVPGLHVLDFEACRLRLLLAFGDVAALLPGLQLQAGAFYLDGFAPARNPAMWEARVLKALGRRAAPDATLATWSVASAVRAGLRTAGFEPERRSGIGGKREITVARFRPSWHQDRHPPVIHPPMQPPQHSDALVVGAGLAGAAVAQALTRMGLRVTVLESQATSAAGASGNPAGLFHGSVHADDGPHARLLRAAALCAQANYGPTVSGGQVAGQAQGLLRVESHADAWPAMQALAQRLRLPPDYVQALPAAAASAQAGIGLDRPAWFYPGGGWLAPAEWVALALNEPGLRLQTLTRVGALRQEGTGWALCDPGGQAIARAPLVALCNAADAQRLLSPLGHTPWPLRLTRGQVSFWAGQSAQALRCAVAGDGYALPLPGGGLLCGATRDPEEAEGPQAQPAGGRSACRHADHVRNIERLHRLTGLHAPADPRQWQGRVGWRVETDDRLPICGAVPLPVSLPSSPAQPSGVRRGDQVRHLPRQPGLFVLTALGSRGLTLAPLLGRLIAAQATGTPWPLEQDLVDAIDPGRWRVKAGRRR